ncbi:6650_t:CDS:2 [Rhizophagus irregularis]|nr:6650_t:CDS:2 [Rhizophagus irregularis]
MTVGEMIVGETSVGEIIVGEIIVGEMIVGEMIVSEMILKSCPFAQPFIGGNTVNRKNSVNKKLNRAKEGAGSHENLKITIRSRLKELGGLSVE